MKKKVKDLAFDPKNSRKHNQINIDSIKGSLSKFGQQKPIVVTPQGVVVAGNGTLEAARQLGWSEIEVIVTDLKGSQLKAYALADNRTAELAEWDKGQLGKTLHELREENFDLESIGFDTSYLDDLLGEQSKDGLTPDDNVPDVEENIYKVKLGQVWQLGAHRVMCGDSTSKEQVEKLMNGEKADMVFTDPPYGIEVVGGKAFGSVGGGKICKPGKYKRIENDDTPDTAINCFNLIKNFNVKTHIWWGGNYYAHMFPASKRWIVWDKNTTGNFSDCELAWTNMDGAVRKFEHTWNGLIKASEHKEKRQHPTQKPVALAEWCFKEFGNVNDKVLDLFLGSGSTLLGCEKLNRACYGMELDPHYVSVIIERWQKFTGKTASLLTK